MSCGPQFCNNAGHYCRVGRDDFPDDPIITFECASLPDACGDAPGCACCFGCDDDGCERLSDECECYDRPDEIEVVCL